jgi:branched-chain amino acid transport system ATP-binding protein
MVAIGRALMSNPKLLLCDEVSLGLAPIVVKDIYDALPEICTGGLAVIVVEQDIDTAVRVSDHVYCFMHGKVSLTGKSAELSHEQISAAYFGI